ncbi:alpha/beta hydrolase [Massilia sp. HP4]|uniref:alpha/beta hydrolase n=1 Tax=Massilia sp. HP4 TaxID=2562316 RepID=UPI0010C07932|nr:alpha/beta fold hydrolase [Massilia sp. HP4]
MRSPAIFAAALLFLAAGMASAQVSEQGITLDTPTGQVAGTLQLPAATDGKQRVALIIAGSGPTDRDGNSTHIPGRNDSLRLLAVALAEEGIATVRYDKRGVGASLPAGPTESELRFETYVDDAAAWIAKLKADPRFSSVAVIGHSEGALIGMLAAQQAGAAAFVSIAGAADGASAILRKQLAGKLPPELDKENERILVALENGTTVDQVPPALVAFYRPSVQPYLISWFKYVPSQRIASLTMPVLIVQGNTDIQVEVAQANGLHRAKPDATLAIIPGMNHIFKHVRADPVLQAAAYSDPFLPVSPLLVKALASFLDKPAPAAD